MILRERRLSVTALGWIGAVGSVVLVVASGLDLVVVGVATPFFAFFVLAALLSSPTHRADLERRRTTLRATRRLAALLDECAELADADALVDQVAKGLTDVLELRACWFEPGPPRADLPEITADGHVSARVQHRIGEGAALPPLVALPVHRSANEMGRFILEADPTVGLSPERRVLAVAMAEVVGLGAGIDRGSTAGMCPPWDSNPEPAD